MPRAHDDHHLDDLDHDHDAYDHVDDVEHALLFYDHKFIDNHHLHDHHDLDCNDREQLGYLY